MDGLDLGIPIPEHDENVRYVVHTALVHVLQFFVCRGHEQEPRCHQKLRRNSAPSRRHSSPQVKRGYHSRTVANV